MEEAFEKLKLGSSGFVSCENALRDGRAVDLAAGCQDRVAPTREKRVANIGVVGKHGMSGAICIEDGRAELDEQLADERLTARHAADDTDGFHSAHGSQSAQLRPDFTSTFNGTLRDITPCI